MAGCRRHRPRPHQAHDFPTRRGALFGLNWRCHDQYL